MENSMELPQNIKIKLPYKLAIPTLGIKKPLLVGKDNHLYVHCSIIYNICNLTVHLAFLVAQR